MSSNSPDVLTNQLIDESSSVILIDSTNDKPIEAMVVTSDVEDISDEENFKQEGLTHQEAVEMFRDGLAELIVGDSLLSDLHTSVTLEEVKSHIALEHGQAITVNVRKADNTVLGVAVVHNASVQDLKKAIQRHTVLQLARQNGPSHLSWKYVWKRYWLYFDGQKLMDDKMLLKEYGIRNKDEVTFIRRLNQK